MTWWQMMAYVCWTILIGVTCVIAWAELLDKHKNRLKDRAEREYHEDNRERLSGEVYDVCDACGRNPKRPNSQICKECEDRAKQ